MAIPEFRVLAETILRYRTLREVASRRSIERMLREGMLVRLRKGSYLRADCPPELVRAARLGGRLDCLSLARCLGIFVLENASAIHVQMDAKATRIRPPDGDLVRHFRETSASAGSLAADLVEAIAQACRCQSPRAAIATLDSAWHLGWLDEDGISAVFARLPARYQVLRGHLDRRSESGPETLVRLMVRALGCDVRLQVAIAGVGRVDLVVDGWLIIECDSEAFHAGWEAQRRDRRRDLAAAALGYTTLRPVAEDIMFQPEIVLAAIRGLLTRGSGVHTVGEAVRPTGRHATQRTRAGR